ncbi:MAG: 50S ribosomal protein L29 [Candidatus Latescibacteria bacterium]|nr:50S ribosomal protein L29 [Candidatus Latescibacterota bacterium]
MKPYEIRAMSLDEVRSELRDVLEGYSNLKFQLGTKQISDALRVRYARRNVARLKTILREHESGVRKLSASGPQGEEKREPEGGARITPG